jgi:hypothetical protein
MSLEPNAAMELCAPADEPPPENPTQEREGGIKKVGTNKIDTAVIYHLDVDESIPGGPTISNT